MATKKVARISPRAKYLLERFETMARTSGWADEEAPERTATMAAGRSKRARNALQYYIASLEELVENAQAIP